MDLGEWPTLVIDAPYESFAITFHDDRGEEVGRLFIDEEDNKLGFSGNLNESAKIFFEYGVKRLADAYIQEALHLEYRDLREKP